MSQLPSITQVPFADEQYMHDVCPKKQIYLHHTAGNANPIGVFKYWGKTGERVATCVTVGGLPGTSKDWKDGDIAQGFSSKYWAYHLGLQTTTFAKFKIPYQSLDKISIGVEICNWGYLVKTDRGFTTYVNTTVPDDQVVEYKDKFKGQKYYHKYTDAQIESTRKLLLYWKDIYGIPLTYNEDIWDICPRALKGEAGVYTHNSVRKDKSDIHPQPEMIAMLKSL
jgi:hypothetical protein